MSINYIYMPTDMIREIQLDMSVIQLLMFENEGETRQTSGIWETFHGELYVKEDTDA